MDDERRFKVYCHTFPNGKKYIGITGKANLEHRWNHGRGYNTQMIMRHAIEKYGWENVLHEILFDGLTKEEAEQKEIELIEELNTRDFKYGYNYCKGGASGRAGVKLRQFEIDHLREIFTGSGNPMYGQHHTEEAKRKMSESRKGKYTGENHPLYGKHRSEETKQKLREFNLGKGAGANNPNAKAVEAYDPETGETLFSFLTAIEAAEATGANNGKISECCYGHRKTSGGYHWRFAK